MTLEEFKSALSDIKKKGGVAFVEEFYDGKTFNLPDGSLIVDGQPKTKYSGKDCMQALSLPAFYAGFDVGVDAVIKLLEEDIEN